MKRLSTIIMALALVLGMSQCKKQETPTNGNGGEKVHITLNVSNGESLNVNVNDNGGRHAVAPNLGVVQFTAGDKLYVGNNGRYIGQLTYTNGAFGGDLELPTGNDYLHFYFVGNAALSEPLPETIEEGTAEITSRTISIADQSQNLPVLCYGQSSQPYTANATNYSAVLEYKCALVRFKLNKATDYICTLSNMLTEATIDFANKAITPTATTGTIDLYREEGNTGVRWAILLPGTKLSADGHVTGTGVNANSQSVSVNTALKANDFIKSGFTLKNPVFAAPDADYAVKTNAGVLTQFSVSSTQKVYFSRANLRYNDNTHVWSFHENQIDGCFGQAYGTNIPQTNSAPVGYEMDRFSWGFHSPTTTGENDWVDGSRNLNWNDGTDWGCALRNTAYGNYWRTLTSAEWNYLLNNTSRGSYRFLKANIGLIDIYNPNLEITYTQKFISGMFIAPDNFNPNNYAFSSTFLGRTWNKANTTHSVGIADANTLLDAGCVFLPALGYRVSNSTTNAYVDYYYISDSPGNTYLDGYYWSANGGPQNPGSAETPKAEFLEFYYNFNKMPSTSHVQTRDLGMCVRLVWDAYPK